MSFISVVVVDDEQPACDRLSNLLARFKEIKLLGSFSDSLKAAEFIKKNCPDIVFLDVELENGISAFDIISGIRHEAGKCPHFVIVTAHPHYAIKAIRNEAFDYLLKPVDIDELREVFERFRVKTGEDSAFITGKFSSLSKRETEILKLILQGNKSKDIAVKLFLSVNTVNTHRRNILKKAGVKSAIELVKILRPDEN